MRVILFGATKGMGRALARAMAERGDALFLLGRDDAETRRSACDLEVRGAPVPVGTALCDLDAPETFGPALDAAFAALSQVDTIVLSAARFGTQDELERDEEALHALLDANFSHSVLFLEAARKRLMAQGGGRLVAFSSVAGDRGRKPIALYGATKAGLSHYLESLDHRYRSAGLIVVCVKPGFVHTSMTEGMKAPPFAGNPEDVARRVLAAIDRGRPIVYAPAPWAFVMKVIRSLPRAIMRRVQF